LEEPGLGIDFDSSFNRSRAGESTGSVEPGYCIDHPQHRIGEWYFPGIVAPPIRFRWLRQQRRLAQPHLIRQRLLREEAEVRVSRIQIAALAAHGEVIMLDNHTTGT